MKRTAIVLVALTLVSQVFAQKMTISGNVSADIKQVTLLEFDEASINYQQISLVEVKGGKYMFNLKFKEPNLYKVKFESKWESYLSVSKAADIRVDYENGKALISDSPESLAMIRFEQQNGALQAKHFGELKKEVDKAMAAGDKAALAEIQKRSATAVQEFLVEFRQLIIDMGETPAGYFALQFSDFNKEIDFISQRMEAFKSAIPNSPVTKALERQVYRSTVVSVGKNPPAIEAVDRNGEAFSLDQYKGKILLVDFWAAWCRACRIENPQFAELYQEFKSKGLEIVSISQDKKKKVWEAAIAKDGVGAWRHVQDADGSISENYSISSLPQNVVLDRNGKILAKNVNAEALKELLSAHL